MDLGAICDGVEEADEVCFVGGEAWACGGGTDFGDADGAAGEGGEQEPGGEVAVAFELDERLDGFIGHDCGWGVKRLCRRKAAQVVVVESMQLQTRDMNFFCHASLTACRGLQLLSTWYVLVYRHRPCHLQTMSFVNASGKTRINRKV